MVGILILAVQTPLSQLAEPMRYFDEFFLLTLMVPAVLDFLKSKGHLFGTLLVITFVYFVAVSFIFGRGYGLMQQGYQVALHLKLFLLYLGLRTFMVTDRVTPVVERTVMFVTITTIFFLLVNWLAGPGFNDFFERGVIERFGGFRVTGIQLKQNDALLLLSPVYILAAYKLALERRFTLFLGVTLAFLFLCIINTSRIAAAALPLVISVSYTHLTLPTTPYV